MIFKSCPACHFEWPTRDDLLSDPDVSLIGYQINFRALTAGIMLFNHRCKGTMAINVEKFQDLYDGPIFTERHIGDADCPNHCFHQSDLKPCPAQCECAYVREILQAIKNWPKRTNQTAADARKR